MTTSIYLVKSDFKIIGRDPMLMLSLVAPLLITCVAFFGVPLVGDLIMKYFQVSIDSYIPLIRLFLLPVCPMMFGMIYGFILLDERDGGLIGYLSVTPLGKSGYLKVRMVVPVIYSFVFSLFYLSLMNSSFQIDLAQRLMLAFIFALEAPGMLLFLGAFAGNKVEGMALSKGFGLILISMLPHHFINNNWLSLLAISPVWWIERALFVPHLSWMYLSGGLVLHFFYLFLLYRKFVNRFG